MTRDERERIEELLVQRVAGEITPDEERELAHRLASAPAADPAGWEQAAAELTAALVGESGVEEEMPARLGSAVVSQGRAVVSGSGSAPSADIIDIATRRRPRLPSWAGWAVAAAAVLAIVVLPTRVGERAQPVTVAELRDSLTSTDANVLQLAWTTTEDESATRASGDVVWSARDQAGVMRIRGLRPNNPTQSQYQLWIFDATRDDRFPVDGGVFDIPLGTDEVLVPIDARLPVGEATLFAVTVERPGGVVVSDRERVALVAQVVG